MDAFWTALTRKKRYDGTSGESKLARVLNLFDLTALGVGSTLGLGAYVLAGSVAYELAGPAVTLSFLVAAIASAFAGLCYAEFAARVPKAGSAYIYSYVTVGECVAFTIGWNLILEYVIGTASVARGLSGYIDALLDKRVEKFFREWMPINLSFLGRYPDWLSFFAILLLAVLLCAGVKESTMFNNIFTIVNVSTLCIVIVAGAFKCDPANWRIPKDQIPEGVNGGEGGFMPFGMAGVMAGAATCFYGFVGFDCVATTGEEAKNPQRNIPLSIVLSLIIIFLAYFGISTVLTMMWPYYLQDPVAPFPHVFQEIGWIEIKWIVSIGAIFALCTCLLGAIFPLPRVIYAMANDGIIFRCLRHINPKTKTPIVATMYGSALAAVMALLFNLHQLIDMMSIGTLVAYSIVAICVLILRFESNAMDEAPESQASQRGQVFRQLFNVNRLQLPSRLSSTITKFGIFLFVMFSIMLCAAINYMQFKETNNVVLGLLSVLLFTMVLIVLVIARQPVSQLKPAFKVPFVPYLPCLSVMINMYLMFQLDVNTWTRFIVWGAIGYLIYFSYGIRYSSEGVLQCQEKGAYKSNTAIGQANLASDVPKTNK